VLAGTYPLWTDYVSAFGAVVGILIAAIALCIAVSSANDAARSADSAKQIADASEKTRKAAEAQQKLAELERQRITANEARCPVVERIELSDVVPRIGIETAPAALRIGFTNTGDRPLTDAVLTIMLDPGSAPELTDRWGQPIGDTPLDETTERWPGANGLPRAFDYITRNVNVPVGVSSLTYIRVGRRGRFAVRAKLFHADLHEGGPWTDVAIEVAPTGRTTVDDMATEVSGPFHGTDADLDRGELP